MTGFKTSITLLSDFIDRLYLGLFTELGNLNIDDRLLNATVKGFAGS